MIKHPLHFRMNEGKDSSIFYITPIFMLQVHLYYQAYYAIWSYLPERDI